MPNMCSCIHWDLRFTLFIPVCLGYETLMHYFSWSGGTGTDCTKKRAGTSYTELVFLHPVGSEGHLVYSAMSGAQNVDTLFFIFRWVLYGLHKKRGGTRYSEHVFLHLAGSADHVVHSDAFGA
jgi:hypothetical protein